MPQKLTKIIALFLCFCLVFEQVGFAQVASLNIAGYLSALSSQPTDKFRPLHLRSLAYNPQDNNFKLLLDKGDFFGPSSSLRGARGLKSGDEAIPNNKKLETETKKLMEYFYIGLALPNDAFWVNLRSDIQVSGSDKSDPYRRIGDVSRPVGAPFMAPETTGIIDDDLAQTDIGRIMLETDVQLKKDTARMTSPETPEGKLYWDKLYKKAEELFGTENITIPTLTRPWIVPNEIIIRETKDSAYIYKATLKVMLEEDYLKTSSRGWQSQPLELVSGDPRLRILNEYSTQLIKELIIPKLTKEVNTSKRYAELRQVYYSLILAQWFKSRLKGLSVSSLRGAIASTGDEAISKLTSIQIISPLKHLGHQKPTSTHTRNLSKTANTTSKSRDILPLGKLSAAILAAERCSNYLCRNLERYQVL